MSELKRVREDLPLRSQPRHAAARAALLASGSLIAAGFALPSIAQETEEEVLTLDQVVVTAGGFEQHVTDAPASVTVITGDELRKASVTNLTDALREVQGVYTTGAPNEQDISIRGLPGQYTLILVDGQRQGTRDARPNGSAGYEQSFIPPVAAIERIEVVRGPMSSLYGSDAMGGVINIITKPVTDSWTGSVSAEATVQGDSDYGNSQQGSFYLSGPLMPGKLGLQLWGRKFAKEESRIEDGPEEQDDRDITARLTWTPVEGQKFGFELGRTDLTREGSEGKTVAEGDEDARRDNDRTHYALTHHGDWGLGTATDFSLSREIGKRTTWSDDGTGTLVKDDRQPEITNTVADFKLTHPYDMAGSHTLVTGAQWQRAELDDQNPGLGTEGTFSRDQWALFAEDEWWIRPDVALTLGARYTDDEEFGGHVSPRVYAVWNATTDLTVKGGISTGYRTPDLRSTVEGYYYTTEQGKGVIVSNPDLEPESSTSYELGALWNRGAWELGATVYQTDFTDKIESAKTTETITLDGTTYNRWDYYNVQDARIRGVELTAHWDISAAVQMRASYTYTESEQLSGDYKGLPLMRTPENMASLRFDWQTPITGFDSWIAANYHGEEINAGARIGSNGTPYRYNSAGKVIAYKYDAYTTVDLGGSYALNDRVTLNGAIYNILDDGVGLEDSNAVVEGRRLWLGLTSTF